MKNAIKLVLVILTVLCAFAWNKASAQQNAHYYSPKPNPDRIILNVTEDPSTSIAVNWRTDGTVSESFAEIMVADADPRSVEKANRFTARTEQLQVEGGTAHYHSLRFEELLPNTTYAYRVGQGDYWSEWFHVSTAGKRGEDFSFIYFGDVQTNIHSLWSRVVRQAYSQAPDARLMLYAGDLINRANRDVEWGDWFQAGGFVHSMIPGFPSPGNHDHYETPEGINTASMFWRAQFNLPENGPLGLEETCYFSDVQGVRFISLNSDQAEESDEYLEKQKVWLDSVLTNNPNQWTCITFHHPIFSPKATRDNKRMRDTFKPLFDKYKVDLVLQGHDHTYARGMEKIPMEGTQPSGTMYVVSVSGPKMTGNQVDKKFWMDRSALFTQLYHVVSVSNSTLAFKTYTATGELYDAFDLVKRPGEINTLVNKIPVSVSERQ